MYEWMIWMMTALAVVVTITMIMLMIRRYPLLSTGWIICLCIGIIGIISTTVIALYFIYLPYSTNLAQQVSRQGVTLGNSIGKGMYGQVLLGTTTRKGKTVAVKRPLRSGPFIRDTTKSEFEKMKHVSSFIPVPKPLYHGPIEGKNSIVMQYLGAPWISLDQYVKNYDNRTKPVVTKKIQTNIKKAVRALATHKIAHNDLHRNNIMVHPKTGNIKIIDWGRSNMEGITTHFRDSDWLDPNLDITGFIHKQHKQQQKRRTRN